MYIIPEFNNTYPNSVKIETYNGKVKTLKDALLILEGTRIGILPKVKRRLNGLEREFIKSDTIFAWNETECGMKRWTDGKNWSASKVSGPFLVYKELDNDKTTLKANGLIKQSFSLTTKQHEKLHLISYFKEDDNDDDEDSRAKVPSNDSLLKDLKLNGDVYQEYLLYYDQYLNYDTKNQTQPTPSQMQNLQPALLEGQNPPPMHARAIGPSMNPAMQGIPLQGGLPPLANAQIPNAQNSYYGVSYIQPVPVVISSSQPESPLSHSMPPSTGSNPPLTSGSSAPSSLSSQRRGSDTSSQTSQSQSYNYITPRYSYVQYPMYPYYNYQQAPPVMASRSSSQSTSPTIQAQPYPNNQQSQTQNYLPPNLGPYIPPIQPLGQISSMSSASSVEPMNIPDRGFSITHISNASNSTGNGISGSISPTNRNNDIQTLKMLDRQFPNENK